MRTHQCTACEAHSTVWKTTFSTLEYPFQLATAQKADLTSEDATWWWIQSPVMLTPPGGCSATSETDLW